MFKRLKEGANFVSTHPNASPLSKNGKYFLSEGAIVFIRECARQERRWLWRMKWLTSPAYSVALQELATSCDVDPAVGLVKLLRLYEPWGHKEHLDYYCIPGMSIHPAGGGAWSLLSSRN